MTQTTDTSPAGGAAIGEVLLATGGAVIATLALLYLGWAHRNGRTNKLRRVADYAARDMGLASWAALPTLLSAGALIVAALGMYWDISLHIDDGRDAGPLANPAHYLILFGLFGIFAAGFLAIVLPEKRPSRGAVRISGDWYAPLGGIAIMASSAFALLGFPLDDVWHRIFGQDVTLWGPTHLMLIGGAGLTLIGTCILVVEGRVPNPETRTWRHRFAHGRRLYAFGGLLIGLSTFQAEFDFGVPQFNLVLEPIMLAFASGVALVGARLWIGPGAAVGAVLFFIVLRGLLALTVGPVLGETTPHFPVYLAEAACVELLALFVSARRPYAFGALAGALIGTVGFAGEYAWSHIWMPIPWPQNLIADAWLPVLIAAIGAGLVGAYLASALSSAERATGLTRDDVPARMPSIAPAAAGVAAIAAVVALNIGGPATDGARANVTLTEVTASPARTVEATVEIEPRAAFEDPRWITVTAWQGGEKLHLEHLAEASPGVYETAEPIPVDGTWKSMIRVHDDDALLALPIYLPEDRAIPAEGVPAPAGAVIERDFVDETQILQRELKDDVPGWLAIVAYLTVAAIVLALIVLLGWVLRRLGSAGDEPPRAEPASRSLGSHEATA